MTDADLQEKLARIDHALRVRGRRHRATALAPWALVLAGMAAGAALFAAGGACMQMLP